MDGRGRVIREKLNHFGFQLRRAARGDPVDHRAREARILKNPSGQIWLSCGFHISQKRVFQHFAIVANVVAAQKADGRIDRLRAPLQSLRQEAVDRRKATAIELISDRRSSKIKTPVVLKIVTAFRNRHRGHMDRRARQKIKRCVEIRRCIHEFHMRPDRTEFLCSVSGNGLQQIASFRSRGLGKRQGL